eukprot:CAMPEP_0205946876 /NCGR_PEP_ID=MMETSP1325-20131115/69269_1 /ASSEMBLY_ACC=CAM_ASM_000708 /TAXON_ID=236786 /ORGANISM="Florenciella sp., Strain RCC1007" /LENGTH=612 /DNA_ID=CAMNT_0053317963 /DNA_START=67 /DNA_END=1905 /DNA_ORIENTATION=+
MASLPSYEQSIATLQRQSSEDILSQAIALSLASPSAPALPDDLIAPDEETLARALEASQESFKQTEQARAGGVATAEAGSMSTEDTVQVPPCVDLALLKMDDLSNRAGIWWLIRKNGGVANCRIKLVMADDHGPTRFTIRTSDEVSMAVAKHIIGEALEDPRAFALELAAQKQKLIHIFVDNSNIFFGAQCVPDPSQPGRYKQDRAVRMRCRRVHDLVTLERDPKQMVVFGSVSRGTMARLAGRGSVFTSWEKEGYKSCVCERNADNNEKYAAGGSGGSLVDDALIAQMYTTLLTYKNEGRTLVLLTGDGNSNHGDEHSPSFLKVVHHAIDNGWKVEVWCWKRTCSLAYKSLARELASDPCFSLIYLDEYRDEITEVKVRKQPGLNTTINTTNPSTRACIAGGAAAEEEEEEEEKEEKKEGGLHDNSDEESDPYEFECPLSFQIIEDPVKLPRLPHVYERAVLREWLLRSNTCPISQEPANVGDVVDADNEFKLKLKAYRERHLKQKHTTSEDDGPGSCGGGSRGGVEAPENTAIEDNVSVGSVASGGSDTSRSRPTTYRTKPCKHGERCIYLKMNGGNNTCKVGDAMSRAKSGVRGGENGILGAAQEVAEN